MLFEGDGGLLFHIQELETLKRCGYRILICAMNNGGYGSEFHRLRADGIDDSLAVFGRPPLEDIARGFGLRGHEIRDVSLIPKLFADFAAQGESEIWNIRFRIRSRRRHPRDHQARSWQYVSSSNRPNCTRVRHPAVHPKESKFRRPKTRRPHGDRV